MSMVEKSKLFMEYLLKKPLFKKNTWKEKYFLTLFFLSYIQN